MEEGKLLDKKSLHFLKGRNTDWNELAKDCISFANSHGGNILIGIEDDSNQPPANQKITDVQVVDTIHKHISQLTINVNLAVTIKTAENHGEYICLHVFRNVNTLASTTDGKYYVRIADECKPVLPDEIMRLVADKNAFVWEELTTKQVPQSNFDEQKKADFLRDVRTSPRVSLFVKEKTDDEILDYYEFQRDGYLTNLGILWIGKRRDRSSLLFAPIIQVIRYNEREEKVWKFLLDDFTLNPKEMLESILRDVPDWQESIEIPDWAYRKNVPFYPIEVIRELCANSLAHRTYTMRGDIFINIYHDRMEIHSPGLLPYGVTPKNILSKSVRRNENLSKVFFDLNLMEREGSGYDMIYAKLLSIGKALPTIEEGDDRVTVTVQKGFVNRDIVRYMDRVIGEYSLKQKEIITLGLLAQRPYSATELSRVLIQEEDNRLRDWIGNLQEYGLVSRTGEKKATMYEIVPITTPDTTTRKDGYAYIDVEEQKELIYNDILTHPYSSVSEIHQRIGEAIDSYKLKRLLRTLLDKRMINSEGSRKTTKYFIKQNLA